MTSPFNPVNQPGQSPYGPVMPTQQPGYAPPPAYPQQQPQYQQPAPFQQPQQQPYQPPQGLDINARLSGPNVPAELQGKTVGEAMRYYGIMREDFIRRNQQPQAQPQQQPQQQPQYQQPAPQQQPSAQPRGTQQPGQAGDPMRQYITDAVREVMPELLQPVVRPMQQQELTRVYQDIKSRYPDWQQYEAEIIGALQGADPQTLMNPASWDAAYKYAVGNAAVRQRQGQGQPGQFQPVPAFTPQQPQQFQSGGPGVGGSSGFVESPTPPPPSYNPQQQDPRDEVFAARFGMSVDAYRSWKNGRVGMLPRPDIDMRPRDAYGNVLAGQGQQPQPQQGYPPQQFQQQQQPQVPPGYYIPSSNGVGYGR